MRYPAKPVDHGGVTRLLRSDESGFSLIEVLVSALLVATVSVGTFKGIDTASHTSGDQRQRATAATLAQQEIERLRSMNPTTLSGYVTTPRPDSADNRNGVDYTTSTAVNWRNDVNEGTACTGATNGTRYLALKITTTYTFNNTTHTVTKTGQAAVPVTGNRLIVQVYKAGKLANPNVPVELRNASNVLVDTVNTSSAGCVEWDFLSAGSYTVTANKAGLVTPSGAATASQTVSMATTGANTVALDYDQAGTVTVNWYTQYDRTVPVWCPSGPVCPKRYAIA